MACTGVQRSPLPSPQWRPFRGLPGFHSRALGADEMRVVLVVGEVVAACGWLGQGVVDQTVTRCCPRCQRSKQKIDLAQVVSVWTWGTIDCLRMIVLHAHLPCHYTW